MKIFSVLVIVAFTIIMRLNLPPNEVGSNYIKWKEQGIVSELKNKLLYSNMLADWTYKDFIFVKFAYSERMNIKLIALPFGKWEVYLEKDAKHE